MLRAFSTFWIFATSSVATSWEKRPSPLSTMLSLAIIRSAKFSRKAESVQTVSVSLVNILYRYFTQEFGAPNGICSSITESKHIKAVKEPWRRLSCYQALSQMLTINERLDKLAAARVDFIERGMLAAPAHCPHSTAASVCYPHTQPGSLDRPPHANCLVSANHHLPSAYRTIFRSAASTSSPLDSELLPTSKLALALRQPKALTTRRAHSSRFQ
ncbi:hypothetical protein B0H14DRAFT_1068955 [Mycena olivaceomarginata]|nr:hypothetical protein B0H14DRAFT_1068955 [Mycena olivaceomarginata]